MPNTLRCRKCGMSDFRTGPPSALMSAMSEDDPELYRQYRYCRNCAEYVLAEPAPEPSEDICPDAQPPITVEELAAKLSEYKYWSDDASEVARALLSDPGLKGRSL